MTAAEPTAEAFTAAFARHGRALWVIASAWVGRGDADDVVQETACVAWQRRAQVNQDEVGPWLCQIARHVAANWRRKRRPEPIDPEQLPLREAPFAIGEPWPFDADRAGLSDELANALAALAPPARAALLLQVVLGLSFAEIGAALGMPENTAASHARRARLALREALAPPQQTSPHR